MIQRTFLAMGTDVELLLDAPEDERTSGALQRAEREFGRLEQLFSRFRPDSELSLLNDSGQLEASPDLVRVVELALEAREASGGLFDPTVHDALVAAGYDRSFADIRDDGQPAGDATGCGGTVRVDGPRIELEGGTHLDLGGIGKGYAVDRVAEQLAVSGPCLVNAGGDLMVRGGAWPVAVTEDVVLELSRGAVATSGCDRRRWLQGGVERHHLIDPRTGAPARNEIERVTVVASSAVEAEVLAKVAYLGGRVDAPCVIRYRNGSTVVTGGLE